MVTGSKPVDSEFRHFRWYVCFLLEGCYGRIEIAGIIKVVIFQIIKN